MNISPHYHQVFAKIQNSLDCKLITTCTGRIPLIMTPKCEACCVAGSMFHIRIVS